MSTPANAELDAEAQAAADDASIGVGITLLAAIGMIIYSAQKVSSTSSVKRHQWAELLTCMAHTTSYTICLNPTPTQRTYTIEKDGKVMYEVYHNYTYSPSWYFRPVDSPFDSFKIQGAKHFPLGRIMALGSGSFIGDKATIYIRKDILTRFIVFSLGDGLEYHWTYPSRYLERIYTIVSNGALQLIRQRIGYMTTLSDTSFQVTLNNHLFPSELAILTCFFGLIASPTFLKAPGPVTIIELATPFPWNMYRICGIDRMQADKKEGDEDEKQVDEKVGQGDQIVHNVSNVESPRIHASRHWRIDETVDADFEKMSRSRLSRLALLGKAKNQGSRDTSDSSCQNRSFREEEESQPAIISEDRYKEKISDVLQSMPIDDDDDEQESYVVYKNGKSPDGREKLHFLRLTEESNCKMQHKPNGDNWPKVANKFNMKPRRKGLGKVVKESPKPMVEPQLKDINLLDLSAFSESDLRSAERASSDKPSQRYSFHYSAPLSPIRVHGNRSGNSRHSSSFSPYDPLRKLSNQLKRDALKRGSSIMEETEEGDKEEIEVKPNELL